MSIPSNGVRTIAIAGAAIDLGRACVRRLAAPGTTIIAIDDDAAELAAVGREVAEAGGRAIEVVDDLGTLQVVRNTDLEARHGVNSIDALINAQFARYKARIADSSTDEWRRVFDVNVVGVMAVTQVLLPLLRNAASPSIVNVGSIDGIQGNPASGAYSASKGALIPLTHVMAHEFGPLGIRVNYVARCGTSGTPEADEVHIPPEVFGSRAEHEQRKVAMTPLGRLGTPEETANVIAFLASEEASYMSGSIVTVDGGRTGITPGTFPV